MTVFYAQGALIAYQLNDYKETQSYLKKALNLFVKYEYRYGHAGVLALDALVQVKSGASYKGVKDQLIRALNMAKKYNNRLDLGRVYLCIALVIHQVGGQIDLDPLKVDLQTYLKQVSSLKAPDYIMTQEVIKPLMALNINIDL